MCFYCAKAWFSVKNVSVVMSSKTETLETDRYTSFKGIDCEGNTQKLLARILMHIEDPEKTNAFWEKFKAEISSAENIYERKFDGLCLICARVAILSDLFETYEDSEGLSLLEQIEYECC